MIDKEIIVSSIYTDNYKCLVELQQKSCKDKYVFDFQHISNEEWNLHKTNNEFAFWDGNTLKVDVVIEKIKKYWGKILLFTDADLVFLKETEYEIKKGLKKSDILFLRERREDELIYERAIQNINIGFVAMLCNDSTLNFWKSVRDTVILSNGWDQEIVNEFLYYEDGKIQWELLSEEFLNGGSITKKNIKNQRICTSCGSVAKRLGFSKYEFLKEAIRKSELNDWF